MTSSTPPKKRNRRDQRPQSPAPMRETARDREIVKLVHDYRILSQLQLERLLHKSRSTVQQSLMRLYHHRYLERAFAIPVRFATSSPTFYVLDRRGIELLQRMGVSDFTGLPSKDLSSLFIEHTVAINEFRIGISQAAAQLAWSIPTWKTENEVKAAYDRVNVKTSKGKLVSSPILPDSYFKIAIPSRGEAHFFLELDRGRMSIKRFKTKIEAYVAYYKTGGFEHRYAVPGFKVLTVVDGIGRGRVENLLKETATVPGIGRRFWFAHLEDALSANPLTAPIWKIAGDPTSLPLFTP